MVVTFIRIADLNTTMVIVAVPLRGQYLLHTLALERLGHISKRRSVARGLISYGTNGIYVLHTIYVP